jgi:RNA polymerase sigma factor (sigma-70 family)
MKTKEVVKRKPLPDARPIPPKDYYHLVYHARRHLRHWELAEEIPRGALDARDIVDEVVRQAEIQASRKPKRMNGRVWLFHLLHDELRRQLRRLKQEHTQAIPTEKRITLPELEAKTLQPLEQMVEKVIEPQILRAQDVIPDPDAVPPDRFVAEKELLQQLQAAIQSWPEREREVFELYFVRRFEPEEIAQITGQPLNKVKRTVARVQSLVRAEMAA